MNETVKNLTYTKEEYLTIIKVTGNVIKTAQKEGKNKAQVAEMYGAYYNAIAGLLRSGAMCRRGMNADGSTKLYIMAGGEEIECPESPLVGILKEEYKSIVIPYKDDSSSVIDRYVETEYEEKEPNTDSRWLGDDQMDDLVMPGEYKDDYEPLSVEYPEEPVSEPEPEQEPEPIPEPEPKVVHKKKEPESITKYKDELKAVLSGLRSVKRECFIRGLCIIISTLGIVGMLFII